MQSNILRDRRELINYEAISIKYYEGVCILALVTRHANCVFSALHYIVTFCLYGATIFFSALSHKKQNFWREVIE